MTNLPLQYLEVLLKISEQINSIRDPQKLLDNILDLAIKQLAAERGFILLKNKSGAESYEEGATRNINAEKVNQIEDISHSSVQRVLETGKPLLTFDALSDDRFNDAQSVISQQIRSIACVPLSLKGETLGVIYIDSRAQKARLTRESLSFLQTFANQAVIALENVRLLNRLQTENALLKEEFHRLYSFKEIIGKSKAMEKIYQLMGKVLNNDTTVLLSGETGTGKELVARAIHYNGYRENRAFVPVNCSAIPENLIESELFGHKKGAFTGAISDKKGLIAIADGGTLFLDEIGELPLALQAKLLRFLQDKQFTPVGDIKSYHADVRIIAATNRELYGLVQQGEFREDLFYRLNVIQIPLPPLRERKKDIPLLTNHFLEKYRIKLNKPVKSIEPEAVTQMLEYNWPGNVRELENTIERAIVMTSHHALKTDDLFLSSSGKKTEEIEPGLKLQQLSETLLRKTLSTVEGNKTRAAEMMGVSLRWVHYKMKEWNIK